MRTLFVSLIATIGSALFASTAFADTSFSVEPLVQLEATKSAEPSVGGMVFHTFEDSKFGVSGFWWVMKEWAEFHGGPTYSPIKELTLGLDIGVEQDMRGGFLGRYGTGFMFTPHKKVFTSGMLEINKGTFEGDNSGLWYDFLIATTPIESQPLQRLGFGARWRRFVGVGPYVQVSVPEAHSKLWLQWAAVDPERPPTWPFSTALLGLTLEFP